jgi:hypothetical protein
MNIFKKKKSNGKKQKNFPVKIFKVFFSPAIGYLASYFRGKEKISKRRAESEPVCTQNLKDGAMLGAPSDFEYGEIDVQ